MGMNIEVGAGARIGPTCGIHHGARIGARADIGARSYVGAKAVIGDGIRIPNGSLIPNGAVVTSQDEVARYVSSQTVDPSHFLGELGVGLATSGHALGEEDIPARPATIP